MESFDKSITRENFPKIIRPLDSEVDMRDCSIDINDKDMPIELDEVVAEHKRWFFEDMHQIYSQILKHAIEMMKKGLVTDADGNTLTEDSEAWKKYMGSEEVKYTTLDEELFSYLYDQLCFLDDEEAMSGWIKYYDEPDKRVFYKEEEGNPYGSVITDCVVDAPFTHTLACYDNLEILHTLMPEFYDLAWLRKITDTKGCMYGK